MFLNKKLKRGGATWRRPSRLLTLKRIEVWDRCAASQSKKTIKNGPKKMLFDVANKKKRNCKKVKRLEKSVEVIRPPSWFRLDALGEYRQNRTTPERASLPV